MARLVFYTQAYNAEEYLTRAVESVLSQTYADFVYYVVDDASTDGTAGLIKSLAAMDGRIKPFYSPVNRFMGMYNEYLERICESGAEFMCWLDADDWYEPEFAEKMIEAMDERGAGLAICSGDSLDKDARRVLSERPGLSLLIKREDYGKLFPYMYIYTRPLWGKLYRTAIIKERSVRFRTDEAAVADTAFVLEYLGNTDKLYICGEKLHHYVMSLSSDSKTYRRNMYETEIFQHNYAVNWLKGMGEYTPDNAAFLAIAFLTAMNNAAHVMLRSGVKGGEAGRFLLDLYTNAVSEEQLRLLEASEDGYVKEKLAYTKAQAWAASLEALSGAESLPGQARGVYCALCPGAAEWLDDELFAELFRADREGLSYILERGYGGLPGLIGRDGLLSRIKNRDELLKYPGIAGFTLDGKYEEAGVLIRAEILRVFGDKPDTADALIDLLLYSSSARNDADMFIFAKKAELTTAFNRRDEDGFAEAAREIEEMLPGDADVSEMWAAWGGLNQSQIN